MADDLNEDVGWIQITGSAEIVAARYDAVTERLYVRLYYQVEWWYGDCSQQMWDAFLNAGASRDKYVDEVLKHGPNGRAGMIWGSP
jgi:hypothetical protein